MFTQTIHDWYVGKELIRRKRYGVIETTAGRLKAIHLRPLPKLLSWPEVWPVPADYHAPGPPDCCWLYYNQPWGSPNFLALKYIVTTRYTHFSTLKAAVSMLDAIAELKGTDALVCDAANTKLSDGMLRRHGWEPHKPQRWHRNYIKRFYGVFPRHLLSSPAASTRLAELVL